MEYFAQQVQNPLSEKEKTFSGFFIAFLKCPWNLKHFETIDQYPRLIFSQIIDSERGAYLKVWNIFLQNTIR